MVKYFIAIVAVFYFSTLAKAEIVPNLTFYVEITGDNKLKKTLISKLRAKPCYKLEDIEKSSRVAGCYAFLPNSKGVKISGPKMYLFKIEIKNVKDPNQPRIISVKGFKNEGKRMTQYFNPGNFSIPSEHQMKLGEPDFSESQFVQQAFETIVSLAFK